MSLARLHDLVSAHRFAGYADEHRLQILLGELFDREGISYDREARIVGGRVDFLVGRVGVEVKTKGSPASVASQLCRYADGGDVDALLLVTSRLAHARIRTSALAVPCRLVPISLAAL